MKRHTLSDADRRKIKRAALRAAKVAERQIKAKKRKRGPRTGRPSIEFNPNDVETLGRLQKLGIYGDTPNKVARYIFRRGLDDMMRAGLIPALDYPTRVKE